MKTKYLLLLGCVCSLSCEESSKSSQAKKAGYSTVLSTPKSLEDVGAVDGAAWTLAELSDFFDEDTSIGKVKERFGAGPMIKADGDRVELVYAVGSERMYEPGFRIHTLRIQFDRQKFVSFELGLSGISD